MTQNKIADRVRQTPPPLIGMFCATKGRPKRRPFLVSPSGGPSEEIRERPLTAREIGGITGGITEGRTFLMS